MRWKCYARPVALNGERCGHENEKGIISHDDLLCCEKCGCTKIASDLRRRREGHADEVVPEMQEASGKGE